MGRFDKLFKTIDKVTDTNVQPGDETAMAASPRNALADSVNDYLPEALTIPKQTIADEKNYYKQLPESMGSGAMGTIENVGSRFGKVLTPAGKTLKNVSSEAIMTHPEVQTVMQNKALYDHPSAYTNAKQEAIDKVRRMLSE